MKNKTILATILCNGFMPLLYAGAVYDGSVGINPAGTIVVETSQNNFTVPVSAGALQGNNLFHSFESFNVNDGGSATFSGLTNINNVIARVTGSSTSTIDGTLALDQISMPNANLYFLNPKGVIFTENAQLDIGGSFYSTTADYLSMNDGSQFSAKIQIGELFSSAAPIAFGFLGNNSGSININNADIQNSHNLMFSASSVSVNNSVIATQTGDINITSLNSSGEVNALSGQISPNGINTIATLSLSGSSIITASSTSQNSGSIRFNAPLITINSSYINSEYSGIEINTNTIKLVESNISSGTFNPDLIGNNANTTNTININADDLLYLLNSSLGGTLNSSNNKINTNANITVLNASIIENSGITATSTHAYLQSGDSLLISSSLNIETGTLGNSAIASIDAKTTLIEISDIDLSLNQSTLKISGRMCQANSQKSMLSIQKQGDASRYTSDDWQASPIKFNNKTSAQTL